MAERLLILGGTGEAAALAGAACAAFADLDVISSLAGRTETPRTLPGRVRVGGFGGADGIAAYLRIERIGLVIDATHPFAATISAHAAAACAATGTPRLLLLRPPWQPRPGDRWHDVAYAREAARLVAAASRRAFLTLGPGDLAAFSGLAHVFFLVRLIQPPAQPPPLAQYELVLARPPFALDEERALFARYRLDTLVTKQSGGATEAKLTAAREAGARVVMIRRPAKPAGERAATIAEAMAWLAERLR
ncbi:MAG: cobalt-precorrin-6A reductase [Rhodospirillales bacterium]|nr:cobalt-precorrin-6A reductase [Rhodospirillales bacterium]